MEFDGMVVIVTVVIVLMIIVRQGRRTLARNQGRACSNCGAVHPPFAQFCRRCGQRL